MTVSKWDEEKAQEIHADSSEHGWNFCGTCERIVAALAEAREGCCCGHTGKCVCRAEGERIGLEKGEHHIQSAPTYYFSADVRATLIEEFRAIRAKVKP